MNVWLILAVFGGSFLMDALIATYISAIAQKGILLAMTAAGLTYGLQWVGLSAIIETTNFWYLIPGGLGAIFGTGVGLLAMKRWPISGQPIPCLDCGALQADPFAHRRWHLRQDGALILAEDLRR